MSISYIVVLYYIYIYIYILYYIYIYICNMYLCNFYRDYLNYLIKTLLINVVIVYTITYDT